MTKLDDLKPLPRILKYAIRRERHGNTDKPGGLE